jgi:hypothetical protein
MQAITNVKLIQVSGMVCIFASSLDVLLVVWFVYSLEVKPANSAFKKGIKFMVSDLVHSETLSDLLDVVVLSSIGVFQVLRNLIRAYLHLRGFILIHFCQRRVAPQHEKLLRFFLVLNSVNRNYFIYVI